MNSEPARVPILLPELGAGDEHIRVSTWLVELEECVEISERVVEVLIPGVSFSVSSETAGRLVQIEHPPGSVVKPGDTLGWLETTATTE